LETSATPSSSSEPSFSEDSSSKSQRNSFVGTAEYCSPELLNDRSASTGSDVWAIGCILYHLLAGRPPFKGGNEYQTFQKIVKLEYTFPPGFPPIAADLIRKILILDVNERLNLNDIKSDPFFHDVDWINIGNQPAPLLVPFIISDEEEEVRSDMAALELEDSHSQELNVVVGSISPSRESSSKIHLNSNSSSNDSSNDSTLEFDAKRHAKLVAQRSSRFSRFLLTNELIIREGFVYKRKGLFAKRRYLILTDRPRLLYINEETMEKKGEIPWSEKLVAELRGSKHFFVHTPNRTYYLEDTGGWANAWVDAIQSMQKTITEKDEIKQQSD